MLPHNHCDLLTSQRLVTFYSMAAFCASCGVVPTPHEIPVDSVLRVPKSLVHSPTSTVKYCNVHKHNEHCCHLT